MLRPGDSCDPTYLRRAALPTGRGQACQGARYGEDMMRKLPRLAWQGASAVMAVLAVGAAGMAPAAAATGPVAATPAAGTPQLATTGPTTDQTRPPVDSCGHQSAAGTCPHK